MGLGLGRLLPDLGGGQAHFAQQQGHLRAGELFALGAEEPEIEPTDLLVFEFDDAAQTDDFRLQAGEDLGGGGCAS